MGRPGTFTSERNPRKGAKTAPRSPDGRTGRKSNKRKAAEAEAHHLAMDMAAHEFEKELRPILRTYIELAGGGKRKKGKKPDPATVRHAIERVLGPAPRKLILDAQETVEAFFEQVEKMERNEKGEGEE